MGFVVLGRSVIGGLTIGSEFLTDGQGGRIAASRLLAVLGVDSTPDRSVGRGRVGVSFSRRTAGPRERAVRVELCRGLPQDGRDRGGPLCARGIIVLLGGKEDLREIGGVRRTGASGFGRNGQRLQAHRAVHGRAGRALQARKLLATSSADEANRSALALLLIIEGEAPGDMAFACAIRTGEPLALQALRDRELLPTDRAEELEDRGSLSGRDETACGVNRRMGWQRAPLREERQAAGGE